MGFRHFSITDGKVDPIPLIKSSARIQNIRPSCIRNSYLVNLILRLLLGFVMVVKDVKFSANKSKNCSVVVGVYSDGSLSAGARALDVNGKISESIKKLNFCGGLFKTCSFVSCTEEVNHVVLVGLGEKSKEYSEFELEKLGAVIYCASAKLDEEISVLISGKDISFKCSKYGSELMAFGFMLKSWNFDKYKTKCDCSYKPKLKRAVFVTEECEAIESEFVWFKNLADGIFLTREVVSEPANVIYPETLAKIAESELKPLGVEIQILEKDEMAKLGMGALLGVAQGSEKDPRLVILKWNGAADKNAKPVAFVGKGVTFDSGGISIKPDDGMHEMRYDMAGSGTVLGLMKAVALNKLPVNIIGVMALVENMPSGSAQRPGDIVKSMSGQTIEIMSTDAEGRLILADALWYVQSKHNPEAIIDLATLTGAIVVALGHEFAGLFSNCDKLADQIKASSEITGEKVWRMPLTEHFDKSINSDIADMINLSKPGTRAGGTTAAQFLKRFVNDKRWAHIDIAGVETTKDDLFICSKGVTGFGVHLLFDFLCRNYAK